MRKLLFLAISMFCLSAIAYGQPRVTVNVPPPAKPAPPVFDAEYQGGVFGYSKKADGSLKFDDSSNRLVFLGKDKKEIFGIPYDAVMVTYPNSESVTSTAATVVSYIPLPGAGLARLIKSKKRYLVLQYDDQDMQNVKGTTSFKIDSQELLDSVMQTLADKAKLTQRGDAFYRPKNGPGN
jgi:hypothetical protein